ncbi:MAG: hypothetical protein ACTSR0_04100 [Candidatus Asgardarchaeia archaeon]
MSRLRFVIRPYRKDYRLQLLIDLAKLFKDNEGFIYMCEDKLAFAVMSRDQRRAALAFLDMYLFDEFEFTGKPISVELTWPEVLVDALKRFKGSEEVIIEFDVTTKKINISSKIPYPRMFTLSILEEAEIVGTFQHLYERITRFHELVKWKTYCTIRLRGTKEEPGIDEILEELKPYGHIGLLHEGVLIKGVAWEEVWVKAGWPSIAVKVFETMAIEVLSTRRDFKVELSSGELKDNIKMIKSFGTYMKDFPAEFGKVLIEGKEKETAPIILGVKQDNFQIYLFMGPYDWVEKFPYEMEPKTPLEKFMKGIVEKYLAFEEVAVIEKTSYPSVWHEWADEMLDDIWSKVERKEITLEEAIKEANDLLGKAIVLIKKDRTAHPDMLKKKLPAKPPEKPPEKPVKEMPPPPKAPPKKPPKKEEEKPPMEKPPEKPPLEPIFVKDWKVEKTKEGWLFILRTNRGRIEIGFPNLEQLYNFVKKWHGVIKDPDTGEDVEVSWPRRKITHLLTPPRWDVGYSVSVWDTKMTVEKLIYHMDKWKFLVKFEWRGGTVYDIITEDELKNYLENERIPKQISMEAALTEKMKEIEGLPFMDWLREVAEWAKEEKWPYVIFHTEDFLKRSGWNLDELGKWMGEVGAIFKEGAGLGGIVPEYEKIEVPTSALHSWVLRRVAEKAKEVKPAPPAPPPKKPPEREKVEKPAGKTIYESPVPEWAKEKGLEWGAFVGIPLLSKEELAKVSLDDFENAMYYAGQILSPTDVNLEVISDTEGVISGVKVRLTPVLWNREIYTAYGTPFDLEKEKKNVMTVWENYYEIVSVSEEARKILEELEGIS